MLACLALSLIAAANWGSVSGECEFPPDHPVNYSQLYSTQGQALVPQFMLPGVVYVYTDTFSTCGGCVRSVSFCYTPNMNSVASETLFTVDIRKSNEMVNTSYDVTVHPSNDRSNRSGNCISDLLDFPYCCIRVVVTEPFSVKHDYHYAIRVLSGPKSTLLLHPNKQTNGFQYNSNSNSMTQEGMLNKPLFFFTIDSTTNNCDSAPVTAAPTNSLSTTNSFTSSTTNSVVKPSKPSATSKNPTETQKSTAASGTGPALGAVAAALVAILLLSTAVVVIVLCLKQRQRRVLVTRVGEAEGFTNEIYTVFKGKKTGVKLPPDNQPVYGLPSDTNTYSDGNPKKHYYEYIDDLSMMKADQVQGPSPYIYASADPLPQSPLEHSYAVTGAEVNNGKDSSFHYEVDKVYEVPASSETGLYAQFEKIKINFIPANEIETTECLGSGQFGTVHRGIWRQSTPGGPTQDVAIKTLKSSAKEVDRVKFLQEGVIMGQFRHDNVVNLHGIVREGQKVLLVIELLSKTDLREHLFTLRPKSGGEVDSSVPHTLLSYCRQVAAGLYYLSRKGFIHRDIAARNILLSADHDICKIADFGMSRDLADGTYYISSGGQIPVRWTAPEALHFKKYSTASDVWSFGCLMYEIWSLGHKPFEGYTNTQAIKMVDQGSRLAPPPGCPRALYHLMIQCWHPSKSDRPSVNDLTGTLGHPDSVLFKWAVSDKPAGAPLSLKLGAALDSTTQLYPDLQRTYLPAELIDNDYEEPN